MSLSIKPYLIILVSVIMIFILFACARQFGFEKQIEEWGKKHQSLIKGIVIALFLVFAAAAVPVFLKVFLSIQIRIGNGDVDFVKFLRTHVMQVVYAVWIFFALGLMVALPAMIKNGFFSNMQ
jgi:uncharacterized membrane protein